MVVCAGKGSSRVGSGWRGALGAGWRGDGFKCEDIDECAEGTAQCQHTCSNTPGGYECSCRDGFQLVPTHCHANVLSLQLMSDVLCLHLHLRHLSWRSGSHRASQYLWLLLAPVCRENAHARTFPSFGSCVEHGRWLCSWVDTARRAFACPSTSARRTRQAASSVATPMMARQSAPARESSTGAPPVSPWLQRVLPNELTGPECRLSENLLMARSKHWAPSSLVETVVKPVVSRCWARMLVALPCVD